MNVFYEEEGALKVGSVLADNNTSLQVEAPHGKRSKIKSAAVVFRFEQPGIADFMAQAQAAADELDLDFLWEVSSQEEFGYEDLAREYYGRAPGSVEAGAVLLKLHGAPMYFYKRSRGRYKAAPETALKAALASVERKKQQAIAREKYVAQLTSGTLPEEFRPMLDVLLYKPDKNANEWKALEEASAAMKMTPVRVIERCGGIPSTHDFHLNRFVFENLPKGPKSEAPLPEPIARELPLSEAVAFSIDDTSTTEIDDAFSVADLPNGNTRIGIHIAAPALGVSVGSALDEVARERLSTVYFPGGKITMLPPTTIDRYTLAEGVECPSVSMYVEVTPAGEAVSTETRVERVRIAHNLRHEPLEMHFNEESIALGEIEHAYGRELARLWQWAGQLEKARRGDQPEGEQRAEYNFRVENDRIEIIRRFRGTPIDKLVSELMIFVNSTWGRQLAEAGAGAIYRVQGGGKVRMSTVPSAHVGLGVEQYLWASSPLRRYVDLVNQRQIAALASAETPPYSGKDEQLLAVMREFESAYDIYNEFQRQMERYWCLRWLLQENVTSVVATVLRENLVRFDELPVVARVPSVPQVKPGTQVVLDLSKIDLLDLSFHAEFERIVEPAAAEANV
ncbi:MAG TPA: RNB domain-containing ribonuclease [Burkholderiales bacterium]|nr:RNB domain-containing ribonuclease [Burkholderiales bacterium]